MGDIKSPIFSRNLVV